MQELVPVAGQMLTEHREFYPYGGTMSMSGEVAHVAGWTGTEHPPSLEIIAALKEEFKDGAAQGRYRATALVYDVRVKPPGKTEKQDAIAVNLDHRDAYSVIVFFPYTFSLQGKLELETAFATRGDKSIFLAD